MDKKESKNIRIEIEGVEYEILYKTRLGFIKQIQIFKLYDKNYNAKLRACKNLDCKIIKASTIKDWLNSLLFKIRYKFCKKSC